MSRNPNRQRRRFFAFFITLFIFTALCTVLFLFIFSRVPFGSRCFSIENNTFFELPSSAQVVQDHHLEDSVRCIIWVRFQVSPNELASFVSTTFIKMPLSSTTLPQLVGGISYLQNETGWKLSPLNAHLAGEAAGTGQRAVDEQMIYVDTSNPQQYIVYLATSVYWDIT